MANSGRCKKCGELAWHANHSVNHDFEPEPISGEASPLCTLTGHECGTDTVMKGHTCPDERNHFQCPKVNWAAGGASTGEQPPKCVYCQETDKYMPAQLFNNRDEKGWRHVVIGGLGTVVCYAAPSRERHRGKRGR